MFRLADDHNADPPTPPQTVDNDFRATARYKRNGGKGRKPKKTTFPRMEIDDGRSFQIGYDEDKKEWFLF